MTTTAMTLARNILQDFGGDGDGGSGSGNAEQPTPPSFDEEAGTMTIYIKKTFDDLGTTALRVKECYTIMAVKCMYEGKAGIPHSIQVLRFNDSVMQDEFALEDGGIRDGDQLDLVS